MDFQSKIKKLYYSIGEVSKITDLKQYVLRFWETEFPSLQPAKNSSGNRIYKENDIKLIKMIKHLLYDDKLSSNDVIKTIQKYKDDNIYKKKLNKYDLKPEKKHDELMLKFDTSEDQSSGKSIDDLLRKIQINLESIIQILGESSN
ncbi:MAG: MerR family transcriptional regulator [Candidatus Marinimicrobia bacterium]|nr:MerR family transcriptional regulator [Candidatus Neomarinimicrobiota bacterium]